MVRPGGEGGLEEAMRSVLGGELARDELGRVDCGRLLTMMCGEGAQCTRRSDGLGEC